MQAGTALGGASGIYVASLLERLGIADAMRSKTKLFQERIY
jgi:hypothetical protein